MRNLHSMTAPIIAAVIVSIVTGGCMTTQPGHPRYLGFSERVTQGGKQLYAGSNLTERDQVLATAELRGARQVKQTMETTILLAGFKQAIIQRELPSQGFESNFGRETDFVFSIQPCNQVVERNNLMECGDQSAPPPVSVRKKITLVGGQKVTVQFPDGIVWTYQVLDQASPLVSN